LYLDAASLIIKAFLGDVNEILAAEETDDDDIVSSDGPAPTDRSCNRKQHQPFEKYQQMSQVMTICFA